LLRLLVLLPRVLVLLVLLLLVLLVLLFPKRGLPLSR
jgi:hypothetical protein